MIHFGPFPEDPKQGDKVKITDYRSTFYGQVGVCEKQGERGGWWVRHEDGRLVYHPLGYQKVATVK